MRNKYPHSHSNLFTANTLDREGSRRMIHGLTDLSLRQLKTLGPFVMAMAKLKYPWHAIKRVICEATWSLTMCWRESEGREAMRSK